MANTYHLIHFQEQHGVQVYNVPYLLKKEEATLMEYEILEVMKEKWYPGEFSHFDEEDQLYWFTNGVAIKTVSVKNITPGEGHSLNHYLDLSRRRIA